MFSLEPGDELANKICDCHGEQHESLVGFIKQHNDAYTLDFAALQTGRLDVTVGLTVSSGKWWDH